jgi:hypothetical protein
MYQVCFHHDQHAAELESEDGTLTLLMSDATQASTITLTESDPEGAPFAFSGTINLPAGWYTAQLFDGSELIYTGRILLRLADTANLIDDPAAISAEIMAHGDDQWGIGASEVTVTQFGATALAQLAGKTIVVNTTALVNNQLCRPIIRGDALSADIGTALELSNSSWPDLPDGTTITLNARLPRTGQAFSWPGSVTVRTGAKAIRFERTASQTLDLKSGVYTFEIIATIPDSQPAHLVGPEATLRVLSGLA